MRDAGSRGHAQQTQQMAGRTGGAAPSIGRRKSPVSEGAAPRIENVQHEAYGRLHGNADELIDDFGHEIES